MSALLRQMLPAASSQTTHTVNAFCRLLVLYFEFVLGPAAKVNLETFLGWCLWKTLKSVCVEEKSERTVEKKYFPGRRLLWSRSRRKHWMCRCRFSHNGSRVHPLLTKTKTKTKIRNRMCRCRFSHKSQIPSYCSYIFV